MRINKTLKNTQYAVISQIISIIISFVNRTIFIHSLSADYLGINGLFGNILSILSLAELGVGSAITYNMYKPLAINDETQVKKLMGFYKMAYTTIGTFVFLAGICLLPFLDFFTNGQLNIEHFKLIYSLYVLNSAVSYFFTYKRSIIFADQNNYIDSINKCQQSVIQSIGQNLVLLLTHNYIFYFSVQIIATILFNFIISKKADKMYPFLIGNKERLESSERKKIIKDVGALMMHRIGYVVVVSTDNILISKFVSIAAVGLYSNYIMIINAVKGILIQFITGVTASVGNLNAVESKEKSFEIFKKLYFANAWIVGFCSISFYVLFNPFIKLWLGTNYLLPSSIVLLICINFYICDTNGIRSITNTFKDSMGLFWWDRYKPIFEASINLIASIALLKVVGFIGVFLGTLISTVTTDIWVEPYVLFKYGFKRKLIDFWRFFIKYSSVVFISGMITKYCCSLLRFSPVLNFLVSMFIVVTIPNLIFLSIFYRTEECRYFTEFVTKIIKKAALKINDVFLCS